MHEPTTLRCPVCGGQRITPPTATGISSDATHLRYKTPGGGFLDQGILLVAVGRACLDCGHLLMFLNPESLATARRQTEFVAW